MIQLITQPDSVRVGICYRLGYGDPGWRWVPGEGRYSQFRPGGDGGVIENFILWATAVPMKPDL